MNVRNSNLTAEQIRRIESSIADCDRYINKEESRAADIRPVDVQRRLEWYKEHRNNLRGMLQ